MRLGILSKTWGLASKNNTFLLISNVILAAGVAVLSVMAFNNRERIVLTPPYLDKRVEVSWKSASKEYYEGWGLYIASMIGNVTPKSVGFVADQLSIMLDSSIYTPMRTKLLSLLEDPNFTRSNTFAYFAPEKVIYEPEMNRVFVQGRLNSSTANIFTDGKESKTSEAVVYEMDFIIKNGQPVVVRYDNYKGSEPHTQAWLRSHQGSVNKRKPGESASAIITPDPVASSEPDEFTEPATN